MTPGLVRTHTGKLMDVTQPTPWMVDRIDVAWALSHEPRWGGATDRHFSVAEHSMWVARIVRKLVPRERADLASLHGLLHDAHEAYLKDVPTPLKRLLHSYEVLAQGVQLAILDHFELAEPDVVISRAVKLADGYSAWFEARGLLASAVSDCELIPPQDIIDDVQMHTSIRSSHGSFTMVREGFLRQLEYLLRLCK